MTCFSGGTLDVYVEPQQPRPRLLVIGHLPAAQALAHLGKAMSYRVVAVDPEGSGAMAHADEVLRDLEQIASRVDPVTYVVVVSHGHYDEAALERVLATRAPYIGLVASRQRSQPILEHLRQQGFGDDDLARISAPAGLDIGARRGDEIAVSIIAEIVQRRGRTERVEWPVDDAEQAAGDAGDEGETEPTAAVDPICGMTVRTRDAQHTHEHRGTEFYFCCDGCRAKFAADPEQYLASEASSRLSRHAT